MFLFYDALCAIAIAIAIAIVIVIVIVIAIAIAIAIVVQVQLILIKLYILQVVLVLIEMRVVRENLASFAQFLSDIWYFCDTVKCRARAFVGFLCFLFQSSIDSINHRFDTHWTLFQNFQREEGINMVYDPIHIYYDRR